MHFIKFLLFVCTCTFTYFLHSLWAGQYSPIDVLGLVASTAGITVLFLTDEGEAQC